MLHPADIDVAIICGGLGKRLREAVPDRPKPMAEVGGRPFLDMLIEYVSGFGFRRFVLCTGYRGEMIEEHYAGRDDLEFVFSREDEPLGTGGALKHAGPLIRSRAFIAMNGDSLCSMDMKGLLDFYGAHGATATIALVRPKAEAEYGAVAIDPEGRVTSFTEKQKSEAYINAGVYMFPREVLGLIPEGREYSLEYELFPSMLERGVYGYVTGAELIDIGTAERYAGAQDFIDEILKGRGR
jgi:D-glycero-alpha-D-manno-heptose 1-phosphate guanylyltransferase